MPRKLHALLQPGFIITSRADGNALARGFADDMSSKRVRAVMTKYGFALPGEAVGKRQGGTP